MVLLTSSAVSGIIFAGVVSLFTFLLFLSGYILQQQTVRALQESLRRPPENKAIPTLPVAFTILEEENSVDVSDALKDTLADGFDGSEYDRLAVTSQEEATLDTSDDQISEYPMQKNQRLTDNYGQIGLSLAYILSVPDPLDICSVLLFAKHQRQHSGLETKPSIMVLYPTIWESSGAATHISALALMRNLQEELSLTYHPVSITSARGSRASLASQLLGELQRLRWNYDRAIYLRSPGLAVDVESLDRTLAASSIRRSWSPLAASAGLDPDMLFYAKDKGLMMARGDTRKLTASVTGSLSIDGQHIGSEIEEEENQDEAAYVLFDNEQLEHYANRDDQETEPTSALVETFLKERKGICEGRGLLPGEDKVELKKRSR